MVEPSIRVFLQVALTILKQRIIWALAPRQIVRGALFPVQRQVLRF